MRFRAAIARELTAYDAVIVPVRPDGSAPSSLPRALRADAERVARAAGGLRLHAVITHWAGRPERIVLVGAGVDAHLSAERVRKVVSAGIRSLWRSKARKVAVVVDPAAEAALGVDAAVTASVDGAIYASWRPEVHRSRPEPLAPIGTVGILASAVSPRAVRRGEAVGEAVNFSRRLANEPANLMTPRMVADAARAVAAARGLECEVLGEDRCRALGMNSFLSVAQGTHEPAQFVVMRYEGRPGSGWDIALVGKGITFDSGGTSIKPAEDMYKMKADMTGAGAVIGAIGAIARLKSKARVLAVAPCTENLPGGGATKPGDVFTSMSGKTVEVLNTDAEGRLVLIDALTYAQREGAKRVVDIATLTGAIHVALGDHFSGLFGKPDGFVDRVREIAAGAGDRLWPMPLTDEFREEVRGEIADIRNSAGRHGAASKAAAFIDAVIDEGAEWAHLDIASQDWLDRDHTWSPKGPAGPGVRTLIALAEASAQA